MEQAFIADSMLGRLARWLRIIGCDVEYFTLIDDGELVERAWQSGRLLLTRDTLLVQRRRARDRCFLVAGDHFRDQLRQVVEVLGIDPFSRFLTRCPECNTLLQELDREGAEAIVPPYVFATQQQFRACSTCGRVYWGGTHRERMVEELKEILSVKK